MTTNRRVYTDGQLKNQLTKLDPEKQQEFLRFSDYFIEKESDIYLDTLSQSRNAFSDALSQIKRDLGFDTVSDEEDDEDETEETTDGNFKRNGASEVVFFSFGLHRLQMTNSSSFGLNLTT
ncbi:hypothetical protein FBUS_01753 [Fasciolopsis buskii]|uniref:Uncharacterized protein n=1 Tax=Fasciolopsis buskii TaxID=27845 RepID=A0A8E0VRE3_9TREM|nr:hypothetical protein FBUS_01753 [Fasciolopsis buski]